MTALCSRNSCLLRRRYCGHWWGQKIVERMVVRGPRQSLVVVVGREFVLKWANGNRILCNQGKDSVLLLKRILKVQVSTFTTTRDHSRNQAVREPHIGSSDTAEPRRNLPRMAVRDDLLLKSVTYKEIRRKIIINPTEFMRRRKPSISHITLPRRATKSGMWESTHRVGKTKEATIFIGHSLRGTGHLKREQEGDHRFIFVWKRNRNMQGMDIQRWGIFANDPTRWSRDV